MAPLGGEFDDRDDETSGPLLPPEDRLWRHPSEIGRSSAPLDPAEVRRDWLAREPTRANTWTAGLVGALLATGVVIVGTHLAGVLTNPRAVEETAATSAAVTPHPLTEASVFAVGPLGVGLGATIRASMSRIGRSMAMLDASNGKVDQRSLGIVISPDGTVLTAAASVAGATSVLVTLAGTRVSLVGTVTTDQLSGLAIVHVNGMSGLTPVALTAGAPTPTDTVFVLSSPDASTYAVGAVANPSVSPEVNGVSLIDAVQTDVAASDAPLGSPVLAPNGSLEGIVTGSVATASDTNEAVFVPGWLASPVAAELSSMGQVHHGELGITGTTATAIGDRSTGVRVSSVTPRSAASGAGITAGDVIVSVDNAPVTSMPALKGRLYVMKPGESVLVGVEHKGVHHTARATLDDDDD